MRARTAGMSGPSPTRRKSASSCASATRRATASQSSSRFCGRKTATAPTTGRPCGMSNSRRRPSRSAASARMASTGTPLGRVRKSTRGRGGASETIAANAGRDFVRDGEDDVVPGVGEAVRPAGDGMVAFLQVVFGVGDGHAGTPAGDARHNPGRGHVRLQQIAARSGHHLLQARQRRGQERERFERAGGRVRPVVERRCPGRGCALAQAVEREALGGDGGSERVLPGGDVGESIGETAPVQVGQRVHEQPFRAAETEALDHDGDIVGGEGVTQGDGASSHHAGRKKNPSASMA